jgi:Flp pilus assembly pilin Flp
MSKRGQSLVEYALILALIAVVAIVGVAYLGQVVLRVLSDLGSSI